MDIRGAPGNCISDNLAPRLGFTYMLTPMTVARAGFGIVFFDQSGITTPFTTPQFPFIQNVQQKTQDNINAAFTLANGPSVAPIPFISDAGLGQSVYTAKRTAGSGYVQQWNLAVQRAITNNLSADIAVYVGSHVVHVGIARLKPQSAYGCTTRGRSGLATAGLKSLLRTTASFEFYWWNDCQCGPTAETLPTFSQRRDLPQQYRPDKLQRLNELGEAVAQTKEVAQQNLALKRDVTALREQLDTLEAQLRGRKSEKPSPSSSPNDNW